MKKCNNVILGISSSIKGGAQTKVLAWIEALIKRNIKIIVLCPEGFLYEKIKV